MFCLSNFLDLYTSFLYKGRSSSTGNLSTKRYCKPDQMFVPKMNVKLMFLGVVVLLNIIVYTSGQRGLPGPASCRCPKGPKGQKGSSGRQGPRGDYGIRGPTGRTGSKELKGDRGSVGRKGQSGRRGLPGPPGQPASTLINFRDKPGTGQPGPNLKGIIGPPGIPGPQGMKGDRGIRGPPGEKGKKGPPGEDIIVKGEPGEPGKPGEKGNRGPRGFVGPTGANGIQGKVGDPGPPSAGSAYTIWGKSSCSDKSTLVFSGVALATQGNPPLCVPTFGKNNKDIFLQFFSPTAPTPHANSPSLHKVGQKQPNGKFSETEELKCASCFAEHRSEVFVIPATSECPPSELHSLWVKEYNGVIMTSPTETGIGYLCVSVREELLGSNDESFDDEPTTAYNISPVSTPCLGDLCKTAGLDLADQYPLSCVVCSKLLGV